MENILFKQYQGPAILDIIDELAGLRIEIFREFPYLYDGDLAYETNYLQTYIKSENAVIITAWNNNKLIGAISGIPLNDEVEAFKIAFRKKHDLNTLFYIGECLFLPSFRRMGLSKQIFEMIEIHIHSLYKIKTICFCVVERPYNHHLRPLDYKNADTIWQKMGYSKNNELYCYFDWKDIDKANADTKKMIFWTKEI